MNTAARLLNQNVISRDWVVSVLLTKTQLLMGTLILAVLTSALSVIYVTNTSRTLNASIQQTLAERNHLHIQWGQLLLERSTWIMQARVQNIAEGKLDMVLPDSKTVVVVNE
jgi:cell division protein FtsL